MCGSDELSERERLALEQQAEFLRSMANRRSKAIHFQATVLGVLATGVSIGIEAGELDIGQFTENLFALDTLVALIPAAAVVLWLVTLVTLRDLYAEFTYTEESNSEDRPRRSLTLLTPASVEGDEPVERNVALIRNAEREIRRLYLTFGVVVVFFLAWMGLHVLEL